MSLMRQYEKDTARFDSSWGGISEEKWVQLLEFILQTQNVFVPGFSNEAKDQINAYLNNNFLQRFNELCICENDFVGGTKCGPSSGCTHRNKACMECGPDCSVEGCRCLNNEMSKGVADKKLSLEFRGPIGCGMVARENINKGEFIGQYVGELYTGENNPHGEVSNYGAEITRKTRQYGRTVVEAYRCSNGMRYLNSSCRPNAVVYPVKVGDTLKLGVYASKRITKRTEVTWWYGQNYHEIGVTCCRCWDFEKCPDVHELTESLPKLDDRDYSIQRNSEISENTEKHKDYVERIGKGLVRRGFQFAELKQNDIEAFRKMKQMMRKEIYELKPEIPETMSYLPLSPSLPSASSLDEDDNFEITCGTPPKMTMKTRSYTNKKNDERVQHGEPKLFTSVLPNTTTKSRRTTPSDILTDSSTTTLSPVFVLERQIRANSPSLFIPRVTNTTTTTPSPIEVSPIKGSPHSLPKTVQLPSHSWLNPVIPFGVRAQLRNADEPSQSPNYANQRKHEPMPSTSKHFESNSCNSSSEEDSDSSSSSSSSSSSDGSDLSSQKNEEKRNQYLAKKLDPVKIHEMINKHVSRVLRKTSRFKRKNVADKIVTKGFTRRDPSKSLSETNQSKTVTKPTKPDTRKVKKKHEITPIAKTDSEEEDTDIESQDEK